MRPRVQADGRPAHAEQGCVDHRRRQGHGPATGAALAALGAEKIILVDWQGEEGTRARDAINAQAGRTAAEFIYCDLSSIGAVKALAKEICGRHRKLDVLINNAGITDPVRRLSSDGFEMHLATCHLSHFMLSNLLLGPLQASGAGRIVCITSAAYKAGPGLDFDDINNEKIWRGKPASNGAAFKAYHRAKLCNIYLMKELHERLQGRGLTVNAASPGYFINTSIHRQLTGVFALGARVVFGIGHAIASEHTGARRPHPRLAGFVSRGRRGLRRVLRELRTAGGDALGERSANAPTLMALERRSHQRQFSLVRGHSFRCIVSPGIR